MKIVPRSEWIEFAHLLIFHGRRVCAARSPQCGVCTVQDLCPSARLFLNGKAKKAGKARKAKKARKARKAEKKPPKPRKPPKSRPTRKPKPPRRPKRKYAPDRAR